MLRLTEPFHGAVLNHRLGVQTEAGLTLTARGEAPPYGRVTVNGVPATLKGGQFTAPVTLTQFEQDITAVYEGSYGRQEHTVRVLWDKLSRPRYRFSIDDNSFWLRDVTRQGYDSLFDCFYLNVLRTLNREYGAKFTVNIYYQTDDNPSQPFTLPEFPDRYRGEFEAAADWLVLAFHAQSNLPDRPYQYASAAKLMGDLERVEEQIVRFAGPQTLAPPTVIHWGMVQPGALPALYDHGVRALSGFAHPTSHGYDVHYWVDDARAEYLWNHEALMDFTSGIVFSRVDLVCNNTTVADTAPQLQACLDNPEQAEIMDLFTHEQYFWPFYANYVPDHADRLDAALRWVTEHGYEPVFLHEGFLGGPVG